MTARFMKKRIANKGAVPGTPIFIGEQKEEKARIRIMDYGASHCTEKEIDDIKNAVEYRDTDTVTWINIDGLHAVETVNEIGTLLNLHPLVLEDIVNTSQAPKIEEFDNCLLIIMKILHLDENSRSLIGEQFSMVIAPRFLISFQERKTGIFDAVRERIRKAKGRIRKLGSDYLAYALFDTVVDNYFYMIEKLGESIEEIDDKIIDQQDKEVLHEIYKYKRELIYFRKAVRPLREVGNQLIKMESAFISEELIPFIRDLNDLIVQTNEAVDLYRDMLSEQLNVYSSGISNRMNEVMKVLTIFAAIFIPLTFVAGIYGTNFEYLPELHFHYSYFIFLGIMLIIALLMIYIFKRKRWI
jgi:magnesium transporter